MRFLFPVITVALCLFLISPSSLAEEKYIGVKLCGACHKQKKAGETYKVWEGSAHANAYNTLKTKEADKIAQEKGLKKPAVESPECLKCHVTGGGVAKNVEKTFKIEEGVTCEACHGPASGYKTIHSKPENKEKAIAAGLKVGDKENDKLCKQCHNEESPTTKKFVMSEFWAKISHGLPKDTK